MAVAAPGDRQLACSKTWNGAWVSAANGVKIALLIGPDRRDLLAVDGSNQIVGKRTAPISSPPPEVTAEPLLRRPPKEEIDLTTESSQD
jgi:hypothetical protein